MYSRGQSAGACTAEVKSAEACSADVGPAESSTPVAKSSEACAAAFAAWHSSIGWGVLSVLSGLVGVKLAGVRQFTHPHYVQAYMQWQPDAV